MFVLLVSMEKEVQRMRRNRLVDVEKRIQELGQEWERLYGTHKSA